ncbi:hypothetical protein [Tunturiibacter gelidoferens]|uniref:Uncharacterized protein YcfJ n=3 Tax=Tunturiibacter TaxID=3154218 RepID=A0A7Y9NJC6_9BACT|nr:hypothetical protein [Edaphobacter lichenicola]MBB5340384.1 uncharacterized protein YcfJ [Edaphobacter lichenicola]NYF50302.1 uncharacterized protein YcfJ [Edaphobacter lichenicola]
MKPKEISRRQFATAVSSVGVGTMMPAALAQERLQEPKPAYPPRDAGGIHGDMLGRISEGLAGNDIHTKEGLLKLVALLQQFDVISEQDAAMLRETIDAIFSAPETTAAKIDKIYAEAKEKAGEVTVAIISIAKNSVEFGRRHERAIYIVASDVSGALTGAATGAKLGGRSLAVLGALAGAVGGSAQAAFSHKG